MIRNFVSVFWVVLHEEKLTGWLWNIQVEAWIEAREDLFDGGSVAVVEDDVRVIVPGSFVRGCGRIQARSLR